MEQQNPYLRQEGDQLVITEEGYRYLEGIVTNTTDQVYTFTGAISPVIVAAAMARLSRRSGDLRQTILDEFASSKGEAAEQLIQRVVTQYGDDSVQQLICIQLVTEGASNLLTKRLEWGRLAAYLEQSTRYIYFDKRDAEGRYQYFTPEEFPLVLHGMYEATMDQLFDLYSEMVHGLTAYVRKETPLQDGESKVAWQNSTRAKACDAVRPVLPVATKSSVGIVGSAQAIESLVIHLLSDPLLEARKVGMKVLQEVRKIAPTFFQRTDMPDRGGATTAYRATTRYNMEDLTRHYLNESVRIVPEPVVLHDYWPQNELDLVPGMLFESSRLSYSAIATQVASWPLEQQEAVFTAYMGERLNRRHKPGRALEYAHFFWEFCGDYGTFRDLQRHRILDAIEWQKLTPDYGYEVPSLVQEAGMEAQYRRCFELSEDLYRTLYEAGFYEEAQYATLLGHLMRYRWISNLREQFHLLELRTQPAGHFGYRKICNTMYGLLSQVYPRSAAAMRFVNQDEDPALGRLAAERASAYKLAQLEELS